MNRLSSLKTFTLKCHPDIPQSKAEEILSEARVALQLDHDEIHPDVVLSVGGDGTLMRSAREYAEKDALLVGINWGKLCFLNGFEYKDWTREVKSALAENGKISERLMLQGSFGSNNVCALNDIVVHRGELMMARLKIYVNGAPVAEVTGDGVIISTPTGSTAYNQSAGGPLVAPDSRVILITPIAAFGNFVKPIVVEDDAIITITSVDDTPYMISYDSEVMKEHIRHHSLTIKKTSYNAQIVYPEYYSHWGRIRNSFNWK